MPKGGKREGAGRKKNNYKSVKIQRLVPEDGVSIVDELIEKLRKDKKNVKKDL